MLNEELTGGLVGGEVVDELSVLLEVDGSAPAPAVEEPAPPAPDESASTVESAPSVEEQAPAAPEPEAVGVEEIEEPVTLVLEDGPSDASTRIHPPQEGVTEASDPYPDEDEDEEPSDASTRIHPPQNGE